MSTEIIPDRMTVDELADIFRQAKAAAQAAKGTGDGGTCNFDSAVFPLKGWKKSVIEEAAQLAHVSVYFGKWSLMEGRGENCCWFGGCYSGQGDMRSRMAEAACKALKASGIPGASMYYQMD